MEEGENLKERPFTIYIQDINLPEECENILIHNGITTLNELEKRENELAQIQGLDDAAMKKIHTKLERADVTFSRFPKRMRKLQEIKQEADGISIEQLPISTGIRNILRRSGIRTAVDLIEMSGRDFPDRPDVGRNGRDELNALISKIMSMGIERVAISKGLDIELIERLEKEFSFKKSVLADWFGVSRQRIHKMVAERSPKHHECWTGKRLLDLEQTEIESLTRLLKFEDKCCCYNNKSDDFVSIFVYSNQIKAFFLKDLPESLQTRIKKARMHQLTPSEMEDLKWGESVSILRQNHFKPKNITRFSANAKNRGFTLDEYSRFLSGCPYASPKCKTDEEIEYFLNSHRQVNGRVYISSDPSNQWIRLLASRNYFGINEFIEFYGYQSGTPGQGSTAEAAHQRHIEALKKYLLHDNIVYFPKDSNIYNTLDACARQKGITLNQYVEELGFIRTLERPAMVHDAEESDMHWSFYPNVFFRYPLLGSKLFSPERITELCSNARKSIDLVLAKPTAKLRIRDNEKLILAVIHYAKSWDSEENPDFWKYILLQFAYRDKNSRVIKIIQHAIQKELTDRKKLFVVDRKGRAFKTTILIHAFATKKSWLALCDFLFNFYKDNLHWQYVPDDPLIGTMVDALRLRLGDADDTADVSIRFRSKTYLFQEGICKLILLRPAYVRDLFDRMLSRIDELIAAKSRPPEAYEEVLVDEWFQRKMLAVSESGRSRQQRKKTEVATSFSHIRTQHVLKDWKEIHLSLPDIRVENRDFRRAAAMVCVDSVPAQTIDLNWYGNDLGKTIQGTTIPVFGDLRKISIQIACDDEIIYNSEEKLHRDMLIFSDGKEVPARNIRKSDYTFLFPVTVDFSCENAEVQAVPELKIKGFHAYFAELEDGFVLSAGTDFIAADHEYGNLRILPPECGALPRLVMGREEFQVVKRNMACTIISDKPDIAKYYQIYRNGVLINSTMRRKPRDSGFELKIPLRDTECRIQVMDISRNRNLFDVRFMLIPDAKVEFNREFYYSESDYREALLTLYLSRFPKKLPFSSNDDELSCPYQNGELRIVVPKVQLEETIGTWLDDSSPAWRIEDIPQASFVKVTAPDGVTVHFSVAGKVIQCDSKGMAAIGNMLYSVDRTETQAAEVEMIVQGRKQEQRYCLATVFYQEGFLHPPRFWSAGKRLYWDGGGMFLGNPDQKLTLALDSVQTFELTPQTPYLSIPETIEDGICQYRITMETGLFKKKKICIAEGRCPIGSQDELRFVNQRICVDAITDVTLPDQRIEISPCYIDKIKFLKREFITSEGRECPIYSGILYLVSNLGTRFNFSFEGRKRVRRVNPVRIVYLNESVLSITDSDGMGLDYYQYYLPVKSL